MKRSGNFYEEENLQEILGIFVLQNNINPGKKEKMSKIPVFFVLKWLRPEFFVIFGQKKDGLVSLTKGGLSWILIQGF